MADISDLIRGIAEAQAELKTFTGEKATATLDVDTGPAMAGIAEVETAMQTLSARQAADRLGIAPSTIYGMLNGGTIPGATKGAITRPEWGRNWRWQVPESTLPLMSALLAGGAAGGGGGGGGGLLAGLAGAMGFGKGGMGIPFLGGLASIGSLAGLAGFSAEGIAGSAIGVGGSIAGAGIGAGLLGLGMGGTAAVGMGTDLAGIGQAASDVKKYQTALNALNTAIATYGANSTEAAAAQQHLNFVLSQMPTQAQAAIVALSNALTQFKTLFDKVTGTAEKIGAQILTQVVQVGESFLPIIGKFAAQNMAIIKQGLQPFFQWLQTAGKNGGLGIFTNLEEVFQKELPTALHAAEQGFELLAKTIDIAAQYGGRFITWINDFLTKMNGSTFSKWSKFVNDMIGLFNAWFPLIIQVGKLLFELFKPAVGLGKQLAEYLTTLLKTFNQFLARPGTQSILHQLFTAHAAELIKGIGAVIQALLPIIEAFLMAFAQIEAAFREGFMVVLKGVADAITAITKIPFASTLIGWGLALALVSKGLAPLVTWFLAMPGRISAFIDTIGKMGTKLGKLVTTFTSVASAIGRWVSSFASAMARGVASVASFVAQYVAMAARAVAATVVWIAEHTAAAALFIAQNAAMAASAVAAFIAENVATLGIIAALMAVVAGIVYLATHWSQVWGEIKRIANDAYQFLDNLYHNEVVQILLDIWTAGLLPLAQHWSQVWGTIQAVAASVWGFIDGDIIQPIISTVGGTLTSIVQTLGSVWSSVWNGMKSAVSGFWSFAKSIINDIIGGINTLINAWNSIPFTPTIPNVPRIGSAPTHRAGGGPVTPGTRYLIGENGPEILEFKQPGYITPMGASTGGGGGQHITVNVLGDVSNPYQFAHEIAWQVARTSPVGVR